MNDGTRLYLRQGVLDEVMAHAREAAPRECCGLLIGAGNRVERVARAANLAERATRYLIDPADHFAALRRARADGLTVVGAYHSHPHSPPVPSPTDLAEANDPNLVHLIVSLDAGRHPAPAARAYRLRNGRFEPVTLVIIAEQP